MARKSNNNTGLSKKPAFSPLTSNQSEAFKCWNNGKNLLMLGSAGSGKTYLGLSFALDELEDKGSPVNKIIIVRSSVSVRDMGFMPGNAKEKLRYYEAPYHSIVNEIHGRGDAYDILKAKNKIEFISTAFLRGVTFDDAIIVVDECQNLSDGELNTIMTRVGMNSRIIFCGDTRQDDLTSERYKESSGLHFFSQIVSKLSAFSMVVFTHDDIIRSDLVRDYIIQRELLESNV